MSSSIILENESLRAVVSTQGGWLERLDQKTGEPILFPKQSVLQADGNEKIRGGCHVCVPNFGPGGDSGLPQHGFGRELEWSIADQQEDTATLELRKGIQGYEQLSCTLRYALSHNGIKMELTATNNGMKSLRISPAFHPYFLVTNEDLVRVDAVSYDLSDLSEAVFLQAVPELLSIGQKTVAVKAENLPQWVLWSDCLSNYVCLEPTRAGFSFLRDASEEELILPGCFKNYSLAVRA